MLPPGASTLGAASTRQRRATAADGGRRRSALRAGAGRRSRSAVPHGRRAHGPEQRVRHELPARALSEGQPLVDHVRRVASSRKFDWLNSVPPALARTARTACSRARRRASSRSRRRRSTLTGRTRRPDGRRRVSPRLNPATPTSSRRRSAELEARLRRAAVQQPAPLRVHVLEQEDDGRARQIALVAVVRGAPARRRCSTSARRRTGDMRSRRTRSCRPSHLRLGRARQRLALQQQGAGPRHRSGTAHAPRVPARASRRAAARRRVRADAGHPLNEQWYRPYTYSDANGDGVIQVSRSPRRLRLRSLRLSHAARHLLGAERLRSVRPHACASTRCSTTRAARARSTARTTSSATRVRSPAATRRIRRSPLDRQAAAIAKTYGTTLNGTSYKTSAGYFVNNQFWKFREFSAVAAAAEIVDDRICARERLDARLRRAQPPHVELCTGIDPEANYGLTQIESQNEFQTTGLPTYFTLRLNLKY